jgi:hypothetical protein
MRTDCVLDALEQALHGRRPGGKSIHHSDSSACSTVHFKQIEGAYCPAQEGRTSESAVQI